MNRSTGVKKNILSVIGKGDILFIVPPFVTTRTPIMGPHILQNIAREQGYQAELLYLNLLLASIIGTGQYESIGYGQPYRMLGERLFARSAYGLPPLGKSPGLCENSSLSVFGNGRAYPIDEFEYKYYKTAAFDLDTFYKIESLCKSFIEEVTQVIASLDFKIVGFSSNWEQNNCCIAIIDRLKTLQPNIITLMGGSNCEGQMAQGIASLSPAIDYIFSGESESTFADFLKGFKASCLPSERIIEGEPVEDLDNLPLPDYDSYFEQIAGFFHDNPPKGIAIGYETSRGCWWAQKSKCSFCAVPHLPSFRRKSINKVVQDLKRIKKSSPDKMLLIADNIMPHDYHKELLPVIGKNKKEFSSLACLLRADLNLKDLVNLKNANINAIFPGIESLSNNLLKLMNKGTSVGKNILFYEMQCLSGYTAIGYYSGDFLVIKYRIMERIFSYAGARQTRRLLRKKNENYICALFFIKSGMEYLRFCFSAPR
jgi:ribosomal peptide maturation radical SAM protein 1